MIKEKCPICGGNLNDVLLTITKPDRFEIAVGIKEEGYKRQWIRCAGCGVAIDVHDAKNLELVEKLASAYYAVDFKNSSI
ncbi:hypothetical protein HZA42_02055 [Candidatus Peregrinibacteria bacterium]|nr:hypothetical protein [Candidatus Peregrinibacteria bacterium]